MTLKSVDVGSSSADPNRSPIVGVTVSGINPSSLDSVAIVNSNNNHSLAIGSQVIRTSPSTKVIMSDDVEMLFTPGSIVTCTTGLGSTIEGEVLAFDYERKLIILKVPSNQRPGHNDVHMLNLDMVKDVQMVREVKPNENSHSSNPPTAPSISIKKVNDKCIRAVHERKSLASAFASGVTEDGVRLFLNLQKTVGRDPVVWKGKDISVNHILIKPPYMGDTCVSGDPKTTEDYVKQLVAKYWQTNRSSPIKDPTFFPSSDSLIPSMNDTFTGQQRRHNSNGTGAQGVRSPTPPGGKQGKGAKTANSGQVVSGKKHAKNGPG